MNSVDKTKDKGELFNDTMKQGVEGSRVQMNAFKAWDTAWRQKTFFPQRVEGGMKQARPTLLISTGFIDFCIVSGSNY